MSDTPDAITRLVRACEPNEALQPDDVRYVNCDDVRGESLVDSYVRALRRADPTRPQVKLFAGHRGVGKSSELFCLRARLEEPLPDRSPHRPFKVIYMDTSEQLDLNDLDLPDLLVLVVAEVQRQLRDAKIPGFTPTSTYLKTVWNEIRTALGAELALKEAKVETGFGSLTVELKNRPNSRQLLREAIERHSTRLLDGVNDLLTTANVKLRETGREGLVLYIFGRPASGSGFKIGHRGFCGSLGARSRPRCP